MSNVYKNRDYDITIATQCLPNFYNRRVSSSIKVRGGLDLVGRMGTTKGTHKYGLWRCRNAQSIRAWNNVQSGVNGVYIDFKCRGPLNTTRSALNTYLVTWKVAGNGKVIQNTVNYRLQSVRMVF